MREPIRSPIKSVISTPVHGVPITPRMWTIETSGDDHGYSVSLAIGGLEPNGWFDGVNVITELLVDGTANVVVLDASNNSQWAGLDVITLRTEGFADIAMTFNSQFYVAQNPTYVDYIISQAGNSIGVNILPEATTAWVDSESWIDSSIWND